jgi:ribonuclease HI
MIIMAKSEKENLASNGVNKILEIYTDGSSLGNPGRGGWGVVVTMKGAVVTELGGAEANTTNNRMELQALIETLQYLCVRQDLEKDIIEAIIHADSAYVLGGVTSWMYGWQKNGWKKADKKPVLNQDLWEEILGLMKRVADSKIKISFQKVKGHAGVEYNERADVIATTCASLQKKHVL